MRRWEKKLTKSGDAVERRKEEMPEDIAIKEIHTEKPKTPDAVVITRLTFLEHLVRMNSDVLANKIFIFLLGKKLKSSCTEAADEILAI
ncbi:hypothetical protein RUM44_006570 [Polyplax serrata]|uniref:Uncharacterized protein n=1 Tax=Polyplax serrata TaxID=468196 RepID=A0ABR1AIH5_POLSC